MKRAWMVLMVAVGCGGGGGRPTNYPVATVPREADPADTPPVTTAPPAPQVEGGGVTAATPPGGSPSDAPEISRSVGTQGGVVVLWTRVVPRTTETTMTRFAAMLQTRIRAVVAETLPGRQIDLRPQPERVCPQAGCQATSVGVLLLHTQGRCAVVALLSPPGRSVTKLVPWAGQVDLKRLTVPFREPPESSVVVRDYAPCSLDPLAAQEQDVQRALHDVSR